MEVNLTFESRTIWEVNLADSVDKSAHMVEIGQ